MNSKEGYILIAVFLIIGVMIGSSFLVVVSEAEGITPIFNFKKTNYVPLSPSSFNLGSWSWSAIEPQFVCTTTTQDFIGKLFNSEQYPSCFKYGMNWRDRGLIATNQWTNLTPYLATKIRDTPSVVYSHLEGIPNYDIDYEFLVARNVISANILNYEPIACQENKIKLKIKVNNNLAPDLTQNEFSIVLETVGGYARTKYPQRIMNVPLDVIGDNYYDLYISDAALLGSHTTKIIPCFKFLGNSFCQNNPVEVNYQVLASDLCQEAREQAGIISLESIPPPVEPIMDYGKEESSLVSLIKKLFNFLFGWLA